MGPIVIVLPRKMKFGAVGASPVDLYARDTVAFSRYSEDIVVVGQEADEPFPGIRFLAIPLQEGEPHRRWMRRALPQIAALNPSLIEVHAHRVTATAIARSLPRVPLLYVRHNFIRFHKGLLWRLHYRHAVSRFAGYVFVSEALRRHFQAHAPWFRGTLDVVYNGLDMAEPAPLPEAKEKIIIQVGRVIPDKGPLEFARAMKPLLAAHPDWRAVMIGRGRDPAFVEQVKATLAEAGDRAQFLPFMPHDEVMGWVRRAAIASVPSVYEEPFGRTALEAMAWGAALICSGTGGLREITADKAVILPRVTAEAIQAAAETLIGDEALRRRLQVEGPARARAHFEARAIVAGLDDIRARHLAAR
ncbi:MULTISPECIES: glycosyltransferase family 4 protein [Inquilinus]|uniref:Glycosyltransferase involved in cell wall biosynthesis n=1 Tax=Inquilinus ginsengisoli TaxID=363840 RepID=A0ABU1JJ14_9PROT|nr:glycosyltransferase family 4 protein [Inquilinus ginsengisoli]MDR6287550.1 glycosyltransferase involved in cell wall biosynthesis [Inquilinus ginsengisoli]